MDWIDVFLNYTEAVNSPKIFRLWAGITAISGALDRRVWADIGKGPIYPNLYTMLIGPPGSGKTQVIQPVKALWLQTKNLRLAPDNITKPALVDAIARSSRILVGDSFPQGIYEIHPLLICAPEFGVLLSQYDYQFLSVLNQIYDSPSNYREERRTMEGRNPDIINPQTIILAGTQPDFLNAIFPEIAWGMGFCSRLTLVYASEAPKFTLFNGHAALGDDAVLVQALSEMTELYGEMSWTHEAKVELMLWHERDLQPIPDHPKLKHYNARRLLHATKLMIISAISRSSMEIAREDVLRTKDWLLKVEAVMPDIFRAMLARNDSEVLAELHQHIWKIWSSDIPERRIPVSEEEIYSFLKDRLPSERIEKILAVAEKVGMIRHNVGGGGWIPRPIINPIQRPPA